MSALLLINLQAGATGISILKVAEVQNSTCIPPFTSQIPISNLQILYTFTGNISDMSGTGNDGLPQVAPTLTSDRFSVPNSAYSFDGVSQWISSTTAYNNPTIFSIGIWFKTTSTSGGGLMGFCDNQTTTGFTNRDRVIYMNNSGQLEFGVFPDSIVALKTPESYNDGYWHFAVATFSPSNGMKLYVDGMLKLVNASSTTAQSMTGYWRLGYFDLSTGWSIASSNYFNGMLDDVFFYDRELSATEIQTIYEMPDGAGSDSPKCAGENLFLKSVSITGATYAWSGPSGFTSALQNPVIKNISSVNEGLYYLIITDSLGCSTAPVPVLVRVATVSITLSQAPTTGLLSKYLFKGNSNDLSGNGNTGILQNSPLGAPGRFGITNSAYSFNGTNQYISTSNSFNNPSVFSIAVWFNTTTTKGGKLIGFGNSQTGTSTLFDRHIYMTDAGQLVFGVYNGVANTVNTGGEIFNDGQWHCAVGTLSSSGLNLYVDGVLLGSDPAVTTAPNYIGYWRIGYGEIGIKWPSPPTSNFFNGLLDDVYIYNIEIPAAYIAQYNNVDGAGSNEPFCGTGGTLNLTATTLGAAYSYKWTGPNGFVSVSQNPSISGITTANAGMYSLVVTTTSSCPARAFVNVRVDNFPAAPVATDGTSCGPGTVNLVASGSPLKYRWYTASSGGVSLAGASLYSPNISGTTTFYVSALNATTCESLIRTPVIATINSLPQTPSVNDTSRCGAGIVTFIATGSSFSYNWYSTSVGGTLLGTGSTYTTPFISATTTYYVASLSSANCESARIPVIATINGIPNTPSSGGAAICGPGTLLLTASGSPSGYNWYTAPNGGLLAGTGPVFTTPSISASTIYYVSSVSSANCESASKTAVLATVNLIPPDPAGNDGQNCGPGTVLLTAAGSPSGFNWYTTATGGSTVGSGLSYTTPFISSTTTYYVASLSGANCESANRTPVTATVNNIPSDPVGNNGQRCGAGSVALTATGSSLGYNWYSASSGGVFLGTGSTYTTPSISATTTYFVSSLSTANCVSMRIAVIAVINNIPAAPAGANVASCGSGAINLKAVSFSALGSGYNWYDASSGGSFLGSGNPFTTPFISVTTTYYVSSVSVANCESNTRTPITAIINSVPSAPTSTGVARCGPGPVILTGNGSPATYKWYDAAGGGNLLGISPIYSPVISGTTAFYLASVSAAGCESISRGSVIATVDTIPSVPSTISGTICGAGTVILGAGGSPSDYNWYIASTGGTPIGTGPSFTTPFISSSTDYFVTSVSTANCESVSRVLTTATINTIPGDPSSANVERCGPGTLVLTATGSPGYNWYTSSTGGSSVGTGSNYITPFISSATTYFVASLSTNNCPGTNRIPVVAKINPFPLAPAGIDGEICGSGITTLSASGSLINYNWYSSPTGGLPIASGADFDTPILSTTTSYYVASVDSNLCESVSRKMVIAHVNTLPSTPSATGDSICGISGTANLTASGSISGYRWYDAPTGDNLLGTAATYSPLINSDTVFYVSSEINNCESTRIPVYVIVSKNSNAGTLDGSQSVCSSSNSGVIRLTGFTGSIKKWEISDDGFMADSSDIDSLNSYTYKDLTQTKFFRVTVKSGSCPALTSGIVTITVDQSTPASGGVMSGDTSLLISGNNFGHVVLSGNIGSVIKWETSTDNFSNPSNIIPVIDSNYTNLIVTTSFRAVVKSGVCPTVTSTIFTVLVDRPILLVSDTITTTLNRNYQSGISVLSNDYIGRSNKLIPINAQNTLKNGMVSIDNLGYFTYTPPTEFTGIDQIDYSVCDKATESICFKAHLVFIVKDTVIIYSSLTPNGDGINDSWIIDGIHIFKENKVKIINRWGDLVYEEVNYDNKEKVWKGECNAGLTMSDKKLPDGTYFYSIDLSNGSKPLTGYVVIKQ